MENLPKLNDISQEKRPENWRIINVPSSHLSGFISNKIKTSRYTLKTFLPLSLFAQFHSPVGICFLFASIYNSIWSETYPWFPFIFLALLLSLTMFSDIYQDFKRYLNDESINNQFCNKWDGHEFIKIKRKKLQVGDIILVTEKEYVPADILVLSIGEEEQICYVDASEIIGEKCILIKKPINDSQMVINSFDHIEAGNYLCKLEAKVKVPAPFKFKEFSGFFKLKQNPKRINLSNNNFVQRGSIIIETSWIFGLVIYTGKEGTSPISDLNYTKHISRFQKTLNRYVFLIIIAESIVLIFTLFFNYLYYGLKYDDNLLKLFQDLLVQLCQAVPICIYLNLEIVRFLQAKKIQKKNGSITFNTTNIIEDLGQIEYILADKTGTITTSDLSVKACIINNSIYTKHDDDYLNDVHEFVRVDSNAFTESTCFNRCFSYPNGNSKINFSKLRKDFLGALDRKSILYHYMVCMAICNQVSIKKHCSYFSTSADDHALVKTSGKLGFKLIRRTSKKCLLNVLGTEERFPIIAAQNNSATNKTRIVVKDINNSVAVLYVKGPREKMIRILDLTSEQRQYLDDKMLMKDLSGVKSIYMGCKILTLEEYNQFKFAYSNAKLSPVNSEGRIEDLFDELEQNLEYLGVVCLEYKIQEGAKETISLLTKAGIKIWMLSGDCEESTISSGLSANLFEKEARIVKLTNYSSEIACKRDLIRHINSSIFHKENDNKQTQSPTESPDSFRMLHYAYTEPIMFNHESQNSPELENDRYQIQRPNALQIFKSVDPQLFQPLELHSLLSSNFNCNSIYFILSIDRSGLEYGLSTKENRKYFIALLCAAQVVTFHSLLPDDKTMVVKLLKENVSYKPMILAVGDGNSDIGMMQAAHIGVCVHTSAANQAENLSHINIKSFSQLKDLILIDGYKIYINSSRTVVFSVFISVTVFFSIFLYDNCVGSSGNSILEAYDIFCLNYIFFSILIITVGIYDEFVSDARIINFPQIYIEGIKNMHFSNKIMIKAVICSFIAAIVTISFVYLLGGIINKQGYNDSFELDQIMVIIALFSCLLCFIIKSIWSFNIWTVFSIFSSFVLLFIFRIIPSVQVYEFLNYGAFQMISNSISYIIWIIMLTLLFAIIFHFYRAWFEVFSPSLCNYLQQGIFKKFSNLNFSPRINEFNGRLGSIYISTENNKTKEIYDSFDVSSLLLKYKSKTRETEYQLEKLQENIFNCRYFFINLFLVITLLVIYESIMNSNTTWIEVYEYFLLGVHGIFIFFTCTAIFQKCQNQLILLLYFLHITLFLVCSIFFDTFIPGEILILPPLFLIGLSFNWFWNSMFLLFSELFVLGGILYELLHHYSDPKEIILYASEYVIIHISIIILSGLVGYFTEKSVREKYTLVKKVEIDVEKSKMVLNCVLPKFVRNRVKDGVRYISENQGIVSVIFCDICDFEEIISGIGLQELTEFLDEVYKKFDRVCDMVGATKIETVGKTYMACAGLKDSETELDPCFSSVSHVRRAIEMGIGILKTAEKTYLRKGVSLKVKIGIHSGSVTAGVVGDHKPQFLLVGDTVNTASRMASTLADPSMIQISEASYNLLDDKSGLVFSKQTVYVKGKGMMNTLHIKIMEVDDIQSQSYLNNPSPRAFLMSNYSFSSVANRASFSDNSIRTETKRKSVILSSLDLEETSQLFRREDTDNIEEMHFLTCNFKETEKETELRLQIIEIYKPIIFYSFILIVIANFILFWIHLLGCLDSDEFPYRIKMVIFAFFQIIIFGSFTFLNRNIYKNKYFAWLLQLIYILSIIASSLIDFDSEESFSFATEEAYAYFYMLLLTQCSCLFYKHIIISLLLVWSIWLCHIIIFPSNIFYQSLIFSLIFLSILAFITYNKEKNLRIFSALKEYSQKELTNTDNLLTKMMPLHVYHNLREENTIVDSLSQVTLIYADIVGFTLWSSNETPTAIIGMLSNLFGNFDKMCEKHHAYKVHTIGDCYVAMGYRDDKERNSAEECYNMICFAESMIEVIEKINRENSLQLAMRIGMHTGNIIGGVVGTNIIRYDIYGNDVLIANKIESNGVAGRISVSEATKEIVNIYKPGIFGFELNQEIHVNTMVKDIKSYFLIRNQI
ncbi:unnamed protein product [Blepharisma stoltei]|uniref:Guanylate cyclase domain-containing protein n=1 Tax=Blepharisma stoltei TaxID=1481888 RepID=A0AAU9JTA4_9CILI|nr:unnamed protein product [Blepharisma stoltei]